MGYLPHIRRKKKEQVLVLFLAFQLETKKTKGLAIFQFILKKNCSSTAGGTRNNVARLV